MKTTPYIIVLVTAPSLKEGERIAESLVKGRLAACVSIVPKVSSLYVWEGRLCKEEEILLVIKARARAFPRIDARVRGLHSYKVPEIIAVPITMGSRPYLAWLSGSTEMGE